MIKKKIIKISKRRYIQYCTERVAVEKERRKEEN